MGRGERRHVALAPRAEHEQLGAVERAAAHRLLDEGLEAGPQLHVVLEHSHVWQAAPHLHAQREVLGDEVGEAAEGGEAGGVAEGVRVELERRAAQASEGVLLAVPIHGDE